MVAGFLGAGLVGLLPTLLLVLDAGGASLFAVFTFETAFFTAVTGLLYEDVAVPGLVLAEPSPVLLDELVIEGFPLFGKSLIIDLRD